jgi:hypothetical protein
MKTGEIRAQVRAFITSGFYLNISWFLSWILCLIVFWNLFDPKREF